MFKGKYTKFRILQTILVAAIFISMIGSMVSGILLSEYVFAAIKIKGVANMARNIHMLCAYWGFILMGTSDGIASYQTMSTRINRIKANGTNAEIEIFKGLSHGFGLGEGTAAEGWLDHAVEFWENNME